MLKRKDFWVGALLAYALAIFVPPAKLMGKGKGGS